MRSSIPVRDAGRLRETQAPWAADTSELLGRIRSERRSAARAAFVTTVFDGVLAGLIATVPMTATMVLLHHYLPSYEQNPLPPREITERVTGRAGTRGVLRHAKQEREMGAATLAAHFGYGAAAGGLYAVVAQRLPGPPVLGGVLFGLLVWAGSYLGLLPALGIMAPATEQPPRRNALMVAAHVVWGLVTGALMSVLRPRQRRG